MEAYAPRSQPALVVTNPPWDRRLEAAEEAWTKLGVFCKRAMRSRTVWALSGSPEISRHIQLKSSLKIPMNAASVDMRFLKYEVLKAKDANSLPSVDL